MPPIAPRRKPPSTNESLLISFFLAPSKTRLVGLTVFLVLGAILINSLFDDDPTQKYHKTKVVIKTPHTEPLLEEESLWEDDEDLLMGPYDEDDDMMYPREPLTYDDDVIKMEDDLISPEYYVALFRDSMIESQLEDISGSRPLKDESSPQGRAKKWIIDIDKRNLHPDDAHLVQRYVLAVLFYSTGGENWDGGSLHWLSGVHECYWYKKIKGALVGVTECDDENYVTHIQLVGNNLQGKLPKEIGALERLKSLDLQENRLTGTLPSQVGNIESLENLFINSNNFKGTVPTELGQLNNLGFLLLDDNELTGEIPFELCLLKKQNKLNSLWADCDGAPQPPIECSCCNMCCDGLGYCVAAGTPGGSSYLESDDEFFDGT